MTQHQQGISSGYVERAVCMDVVQPQNPVIETQDYRIHLLPVQEERWWEGVL